MRDSDIEVIVEKLARRFSVDTDNEEKIAEWHELVYEEAEKEIRYADWSRKSHGEHLLKIVLWWVFGVVAVIGVLVVGYIDNRNRAVQKKEQEARWAQEKKEEEEFNRDFAEVVDMVSRRDTRVYDLLLTENRKLLESVEAVCGSDDGKTEYRKSLEARIVTRLKREIHHCEMRKERIVYRRENSATKARWLDFEVFAGSCDCHDE